MRPAIVPARTASRAELADFTSFFDFLPIGAYRSSPDGRQLRANPALVKLNDYASEAEMLPAVHDIATEWYVDPTRRDTFRALLERDGHVTGFVSEIYRHKSRERIWISENARLVCDDDGTILYYEGTVEEVTDRVRAEAALRTSEEQLRQVSAHIPGIVYRVHVAPDGTRRFTYMSPGVRALYGVEPEDVLADSALIASLTHPDDRDRMRAETLAAALNRAPLATEIRILRRDGTVKWVQVTSSSVSNDATGNVRAGVMIDITERKQAEAMRLDRDRAEAASRAKTDFLSLVSHELRTPLNAILGFSQLMARDPTLQPKHRMWTHEMLTSGRHLVGLVEDILDLSGAQSGRLSLQCTAVDLQRIVEEAWAMLAADGARSQLDFVDAIDGASRWVVYADPKRLKQVVSNLISNAIKYNNAGGRITVEATRVDAGVEFSVEDTGIGMTADQCARAFNPFERMSANRSQVAGTGLGLALAKQLVEAMHGSIRVDSQPGVGSRFTVTLPSTPP